MSADRRRSSWFLLIAGACLAAAPPQSAASSRSYRYALEAQVFVRGGWPPYASLAASLKAAGLIELHPRGTAGGLRRIDLHSRDLSFETYGPEGPSRATVFTPPWRPLVLALDESGAVLSVSHLNALSRDAVLGMPLDHLIKAFFPALPAPDAGPARERRYELVFPLPGAEIPITVVEKPAASREEMSAPTTRKAAVEFYPRLRSTGANKLPPLSGLGTGDVLLRRDLGDGFFSEYRLRLEFLGALDAVTGAWPVPAIPVSFHVETSLILVEAVLEPPKEKP